MVNTKKKQLMGRNFYLTQEEAKFLSELGREPGAINGNMSAGLRKAVEYVKAHMKQIPLDKEEGP